MSCAWRRGARPGGDSALWQGLDLTAHQDHYNYSKQIYFKLAVYIIVYKQDVEEVCDSHLCSHI